MFSVKFNIYYSLSEDGPWTLANGTPLNADSSGSNSYTITGLKNGATYHVVIVGGMVDSGTFFPMISQHIAPTGVGIKTDVGAFLKPLSFKAVTFSPLVDTETVLGQEFTVASIV